MSEIRLVGTAHVSSESVDEVRREIVSFDPDIVAVELDPPRYQTLKYGAEEPEIGELLKSGNFTQLLVQWALGYVQRQIGMDVGVEPGAEMKAACEAAEERGIRIALVDRDIRVTLQRFWSSMTLLEKLRMGGALLFSVFQIGRGGGGEIDIESLKQQDVIDAALEEFRRFAPNGARALIEERDAYLAHQILGREDQRTGARRRRRRARGGHPPLHRGSLGATPDRGSRADREALPVAPRDRGGGHCHLYRNPGADRVLRRGCGSPRLGPPLLGTAPRCADRCLHPGRRWSSTLGPDRFCGLLADRDPPPDRGGLVLRDRGGEDPQASQG